MVHGKSSRTAWILLLLAAVAAGTVLLSSFSRADGGGRILPGACLVVLGGLTVFVAGRIFRRPPQVMPIPELNPTHRTVIEAYPSPFFLVKEDGRVECLNPSASAMLSVLGLADRLPPVVQRLVDASFRQGLDHLPDHPAQAVYIRMGEKDAYYLPRIFRLRDGGGAAVMLVDVTRVRWMDELKTGQIATVSHEIKTPLTAIRVMLHLLLEKKFGDLNADQEEMMRTACGDCERLLRTTNHLLELSRLGAGAGQLETAPEKPAELAAAAARAASEIAALRGIRIELEALPGCPEVRVDAARFGHVLGNFLSNAVKFSPARSTVRVRTAPGEGGFVRFSVIDQGAGIAEEFQSRIFDRFFRLPGSGNEGVGLGLSIAREIVRAHQGRIGVVSAPGRGCEFYCELPPTTNQI